MEIMLTIAFVALIVVILLPKDASKTHWLTGRKKNDRK